MYRIAKSFTFSAAHFLPYPYEGPCRRVHGHNYVVTLTLSSETLDPCSMVLDFGDMGKFKDLIDNTFDHRNLNDIIECPTVENIARYLFDRARAWCIKVEAVRVAESDTSWGEYRR